MLQCGLLIGAYNAQSQLIQVRFNENELNYVYVEGETSSFIKFSAQNVVFGRKKEVSGYFDLNIKKIISHSGNEIITSGKIRIKFKGFKPEVDRGSYVRLFGQIISPKKPTNPGQFDYAKFLYQHGIKYSLILKQGNIKILKQPRLFWKLLAMIRNQISDRIDIFINNTYNRPEKTITLGRNYSINDDLRELLIQTGTIHFFAISGLHIGIILIIITGFLKLLNIHIFLRASIATLFILIFAFIAGMDPSVERATIMSIVWLTGHVLYKKNYALNTLFVSVIIIILINPIQVYDFGLILSFLGVIGIILFHKLLNIRLFLRDDGLAQFDKRYIKIIKWGINFAVNIFCFSLCAWAITTPLIIYLFHIFSPMAAFASLLAIPVITIIVFCNMLFVSAALLHLNYVLPLITFIINKLFAFFFIIVNKLILVNAGCLYLPNISLYYLITGYSALIIVYLVCKNSSKKFVNILLLYGIVLLFGFGAKMLSLSKEHNTRIAFLDVGQGNCTIVEDGDGGVWIFDMGTAYNFNVGKYIVLPYIRERGYTQIKCIILSHNDIDHFNGIFGLKNTFPINEIILGKSFKKNSNILNKIKIVNPAKIRTVSNAVLFNSKKISISTLFVNKSGISDNNSSIIGIVDVKDCRFIIPGDIEKEGIDWLLNNSDVFKTNRKLIILLPHHGSPGAFSKDLYDNKYISKVIISSSKYFNTIEDEFKIMFPHIEVMKTSNGAVLFDF